MWVLGPEIRVQQGDSVQEAGTYNRDRDNDNDNGNGNDIDIDKHNGSNDGGDGASVPPSLPSSPSNAVSNAASLFSSTIKLGSALMMQARYLLYLMRCDAM